MREILEFFLKLLPPFPEVFVYALVVALVILGSGSFCGYIRRYRQWKTGYTRKLLHFSIFFTAVVLHAWGGMPAVNLLGIVMGIFVLLSVWAGKGNFFYESMARMRDIPHRSFFIIIPYLATAVGGLSSNFLFGSSAIMGYVICGAADAAAEPVGLYFGKHRYRVFSLKKVAISDRTVEGSVSIFIVSFLLSLLFFRFFYHLSFTSSLISSVITAVVVVIVEAVSFNGADNFTLQVTASGLTYLFIKLWG